MRFLTLYTAADPPQSAPSPETMTKMGAFMEASIKSGILIATGSVIPSGASGARLRLANGKFGVEAAPAAAEHGQIGGWAILNVNSFEHLREVTRQFLEVAGDGTVQAMEITQAPMA